MRQTTVLAIDDEEGVHYSFKRVFPRELELHSALTGAEGIALARRIRPDVALVDMRLPDTDGLHLLDEIQRVSPRTAIIIVTAYASGQTTMEAMARGAFDFITKPFDLPLLLGRIDEAAALARHRRGPVTLGRDEAEEDGDVLIGLSGPMNEVYKLIGRLAPTNETILITGESGTGKELVARAVIRHSKRKDGPYLAINCAAFPESLLEAELFGYEKGAFTGAVDRRLGKFEACQGGTILLDEIGDMPISLQAKLLRVLQEKEITRLGSTAPVKLDVRILAATHRDLKAEVASNRFRQDLYYRLTTSTIALPPLRERDEDLPALTEHLIRRIWSDLGRPVGRVPTLAKTALAALAAHSWPGNVRELENVLRQTLIASTGGRIKEIAIEADHGDDPERVLRAAFDQLADSGSVMDRVTEAFTRFALERTNNNTAAAARLLGLARNTMRKRIAESAIVKQSARKGGKKG